MLPIVLDHTKIAVGLAGEGELLERRRALLADASIVPVPVSLEAPGALAGLKLLYIAGADRAASAALARQAKGMGILVNVEDIPELCDFHMPAVLRRGELLLSVSSSGRSPGLVRMVREWLAEHFGSEWGERVDEIGRCRDGWKAQGRSPTDIANATRALVAEKKWLA
ncbi:MAG: bifunctional precorrin-2 dehydrogenase/sirohydrochlorin ferrochelatase [Rhizomicrobium sp.]